jgi:hypothetical protein
VQFSKPKILYTRENNVEMDRCAIDSKTRTGINNFSIRSRNGFYSDFSELSLSITRKEFLYQMHTYRMLRKDPTPGRY